jgi:hypothetical protein
MNDQHQQSNFERTVTREAAPCSDAAKRTLTAGNSGSMAEVHPIFWATDRVRPTAGGGHHKMSPQSSRSLYAVSSRQGRPPW